MPSSARNSLYKKKKKKKRRLGRVERLKASMKLKDERIAKVDAKATCLKKKLRDVELENLILQDPSSRAFRMQQLGLSATLGTSGRKTQSRGNMRMSLLPSIRLIREDDLTCMPLKLGSGRFGTCYVKSLAHFKVCVKVFKHYDANAVCNEANTLSRFTSKHFPYLFGVLMGSSKQAIVTSFHGLGGVSVTIHCALSTKRNDFVTIEWKLIIQQILEGLEELHVKHKILHNDLKTDNILISSGEDNVFQAVIIDFGKACSVDSGKLYRLSVKDREQYKIYHPQIAPDLRDGLCKQTTASDVYSFGRVLSRIHVVKKIQGWTAINDMTRQCMMYNSIERPCISSLRKALT